MKARLSVLVALCLATACAERLTGPAAQEAVRANQTKTVAADKTPLMFVNGKEVSMDAARALNADSIESVEVIKGAKAIQDFGDRAKNGVILVLMKR